MGSLESQKVWKELRARLSFIRSNERCLSSEKEISWKTGYVEIWTKKPPKGYYDPLRGFTTESSGNPTLSFLSSEGWRFDWEAFLTRGSLPSHGSRAENSVKGNFGSVYIGSVLVQIFGRK
jgi:hypothetical protein